MADMDHFSNARGLKRPYEDDDDQELPDLDALDPRNHTEVTRSETSTLETSLGTSPSHGITKDASADGEPTTSVPSTSTMSLTSVLNSTSQAKNSTCPVREDSKPSTSCALDNNSISDVLPMPSTTVPFAASDKNTSTNTDSESDTEKRQIGVESCSPATASPGKSPKKSTDSQKEKEKKTLDDKPDDDDAASHLKSKREKQEEERLRMQVLVSNFSEDQLNRYEMFRRAAFPKASIKRLMQNSTGTTVSHNVVIAMSGISKVFVGEVVETALDVMEKWGETGPLQPKHLREAVRLLKHQNSIPNTKYTKKLFK